MIKPIISVVMSVYNGEKYLREAIDSILSQTFTDFEFIIVDDGSTDNSLEIIKSYNDARIVMINQKNAGAAAGRNNAIQNANCDYIAILDADDIAMHDRLEIQYKYLINNPCCVAVGTNAEIIDKNGTYIYTRSLPQTSLELINGLPHQIPFIHPSVMMRKKALVEAGMYPDVPIAQDLFLFNKIARYGDFANINKPLIRYRYSPSASTRRSKTTQKVVKEAVQFYYEHDRLTDDHINAIKESINKTNMPEKYYQYYLLLAKKYLWNNYQPALSRKNILLALKYKKTEIMLYCLYFLSYFPQNIVQIIYQRLKRILFINIVAGY